MLVFGWNVKEQSNFAQKMFDYNFETVKDNSNMKQTWIRGIVSVLFWSISFWTVGDSWDPFSQLGEKICIFVILLHSSRSLKTSTDLLEILFFRGQGIHYWHLYWAT